MKTISVRLFVAALIFACPNVDISIYSTCERHPDIHFPCCVYALLRIHLFSVLACDVLTLGFATGKRISQKLLRNCVKFLSIIHDVLNCSNGVHQAEQRRNRNSRARVKIRQQEDKFLSFQGMCCGSALLTIYVFSNHMCSPKSRHVPTRCAFYYIARNYQECQLYAMYWQNTPKIVCLETQTNLFMFYPARLSKSVYYASDIKFQQFPWCHVCGPTHASKPAATLCQKLMGCVQLCNPHAQGSTLGSQHTR